jgi:hypothetical protein
MRAWIRSRSTYANVVSTLCLFLVLGGTGYAAVQITGKQVKNGSLTGKDVKNSSLTGGDVKNKSLSAKDIKGGVGVSKLTRVEVSKPVAAGGVDDVTATCPAGQGVVSGGFRSVSAGSGVFFSDSFGAPNSWAVGLDNFDSSQTGTVTAEAYCARTGLAAGAASASRARSRAQAAVARQRASH